MDKRYWLIAVVIVLGALALLAYQPDPKPTQAPGDTTTAGIVDLPAVDAPPIATVELEARDAAESATALTTRFERERRDSAWAERAAAEIERRLAAVLGDAASIAHSECRASVCRVELRAATAAARPQLVADATAALQAAGYDTLLERAERTTATLVIGVRTPQTP